MLKFQLQAIQSTQNLNLSNNRPITSEYPHQIVIELKV